MRAADLEPYITLRYIARLFKVLAVLILLMLVGEVVTGLLIDGTAALLTLIGEGTRLLVMAGLLWAGGDLALLHHRRRPRPARRAHPARPHQRADARQRPAAARGRRASASSARAPL